MPRGRKKRHDPEEAPIDGDYQMDVILNRDPAKKYMWLSNEDVAKWKARGATKVLRTDDEGSARAAYDLGGTDDWQNGQLTAYEIPRAIHDRIVKREQSLQDNAMAAIEQEANSNESKSAGGEWTRRVAA